MRYKLKVYSIWEFGKRKDAEGNPHQEDCTFPLPEQVKDTDRTFILCDGMGGHDAGEVASATVCGTMGQSILKNVHEAEGKFTDDDLQKAIADAFDALDRKDNGAEKKMGTTMAFLKFHSEGATIAHIGDSRVYHIRPGKDGEDTEILFETEDHSLVNDLIKIGELTREEARLSKQKNIITRAMQPGMDRKPKADIKHITDIKAGDYFYMCSDGMLEQPDMENGNSLRNIFSGKVRSDERKVEILTDVTEDNHDNHTALIIHVEEVGGVSPHAAESFAAVSSKRMAIVEDDDWKHDSAAKLKVFRQKTGIPGTFWLIVVAVISVVCIIGLIYINSSPDKIKNNRKELRINGNIDNVRKPGKTEDKHKQTLTPSRSQPKVTPEAVVQKPANKPDVRQNAEREPLPAGGGKNAYNHIKLGTQSDIDVVKSDQQSINDNFKKVHK